MEVIPLGLLLKWATERRHKKFRYWSPEQKKTMGWAPHHINRHHHSAAHLCLLTHLQDFLMSLQQCCSPTGPTSRPGRPAPDRSSCGTSSWSCWVEARAAPSAGEGSGASLSSGTPRGWPGCGGRGRANHTWTTTSSAGRSGDAKCKIRHVRSHSTHTHIITYGACVIPLLAQLLPQAAAVNKMHSPPTYVVK